MLWGGGGCNRGGGGCKRHLLFRCPTYHRTHTNDNPDLCFDDFPLTRTLNLNCLQPLLPLRPHRLLLQSSSSPRSLSHLRVKFNAPCVGPRVLLQQALALLRSTPSWTCRPPLPESCSSTTAGGAPRTFIQPSSPMMASVHRRWGHTRAPAGQSSAPASRPLSIQSRDAS